MNKKIYRKKAVEKTTTKITHASKKINVYSYLDIKYLTSIMVFIFVLLYNNYGLIYAPIVTVIYFILFDHLLLNRSIKKRSKILEKEAVHFLEILCLTLETGKSLEQALETVVFSIDSDLANEFKRVLFEIKFGKSLEEALTSMKERIPSSIINTAISNIIDSLKYGGKIITTIYNQIDFLREKRILEIKGEINKIPNKISIISVIFIIPMILLLILGPIIIKLIV